MEAALLAARITLDALFFARVITSDEHDAGMHYLASVPSWVMQNHTLYPVWSKEKIEDGKG